MTDTTTTEPDAPAAKRDNVSRQDEARYEPYPTNVVHPDATVRIRDRSTFTGSWNIEQEAYVGLSGDAYAFTNHVGGHCSVELYGNSSMINCYLEPGARVSGYDSGQVTGARIRCHLHIMGRSQIGPRADLATPRHYLSMGPVGSEMRTVTGWRVLAIPFDDTKAPFWNAMVRAGCFTGTLEQLESRIEKPKEEAWPYKDGPFAGWQADYRGFIAMMRERVAEWQLDAPHQNDVEFWRSHNTLPFNGAR